MNFYTWVYYPLKCKSYMHKPCGITRGGENLSVTEEAATGQVTYKK